MNKRLLALLMAGTITISGVPFSAMAATEEPAAIVEEDKNLSVLEATVASDATFRTLTTEEKAKVDKLGTKYSDFVDGDLAFTNGADGTIKVTGTLKSVASVAHGGAVGFYLPFAVDMPDKTDDVTITIENAPNGNKSFNVNDLESNGAFVAFGTVNENLLKEDNLLKVTIDYDGAEAIVYGPTTYTFDLSELNLGYETVAEVDVAPESAFGIDTEVLAENLNMAKFGTDINVTEESANTYNVTGTLKEVDITNLGLAGYYIPVVINVEKCTLGDVDTYITKDGSASYEKQYHNGVGSRLVFVNVATPGTTKKAEIYVDADATAGNYSATKITLNLNVKAAEEEVSAATLRNVTEEEAGKGVLAPSGAVGKWVEDLVEGGEKGLTFEYGEKDSSGNIPVTVKGKLIYASFVNASDVEVEAGYYVPFAVDVTDAEDTATIDVKDEGAETLKTTTVLHQLMDGSTSADSRSTKVKVVVDNDNGSDGIAATTYLLDFSQVEFGTETKASFRTLTDEEAAAGILRAENNDENIVLEDFIYGGAEGLTFEFDAENKDQVNVSGKLKYNADKVGFYLPLVVDCENGVIASDGGSAAVITVDATEKYNLIQLTDNTAKTVTVDGDGAGAKLAGKTYTLNFENLQLGETTPVEFTQPTEDELENVADLVNGNLTYTVNGNVIKVTGKLKAAAKANVTPDNGTQPTGDTGYYLPVTATVLDAIAETEIDDVVKGTETYVFFLAERPTGRKEFEDGEAEIKVDFDGTGNDEYGSATYTFDVSEIVYYVEGSELEAAADASVAYNAEAATITGVGDGVNAPMSAEALKAQFANAAEELKVVDASGKEVTGNVYSGCKLQLIDGDTVKDEATVIIKGVWNNTGKANITDLINVADHMLGEATLTGFDATIGDTNNDGAINILDLVNIADMILNN